MPFATDEEIKIAHDILLKDKKPFDSNKVNIIKEDTVAIFRLVLEVVRQRHCWQN